LGLVSTIFFGSFQVIHPVQAKALKIIGVVVLGLWGFSFLIKGSHPGLVALAGFQCLVGFWAITWAVQRSDKMFFSIFAGDALMRLVTILLTAWLLHQKQSPLTIPLLSLSGVYLLMSLIQIPFLNKAASWTL
jgi:hypothetical protein